MTDKTTAGFDALRDAVDAQCLSGGSHPIHISRDHGVFALAEIERLRRYAAAADAWLASINQRTPFLDYCAHEGIVAP